DSKSLLSLYTTSKSLGKIYPITRIAEILSSRLNLNLQDCNLDDLKYYISKEYMMFILNILARSYHTGYGFNSQSRLYRKFDKNFNKLLSYASKNKLNMLTLRYDLDERIPYSLLPDNIL